MSCVVFVTDLEPSQAETEAQQHAALGKLTPHERTILDIKE